jgi:hypothetical protein
LGWVAVGWGCVVMHGVLCCRLQANWDRGSRIGAMVVGSGPFARNCLLETHTSKINRIVFLIGTCIWFRERSVSLGHVRSRQSSSQANDPV